VGGDQQKMNLSLSDTFTPISCISSLQLLLALVALEDLQLFSWDIDMAHLHSKIDHDIYIELRDSYSRLGKIGKLKKALYSLLQAA